MKIPGFIKNVSIYGVGGVLTKFVGLLTAPIYTRFLDTEGYGQLDLATSVAAILMILLSMEMHTGYGRSYFESRSRGDLKSLRGSVQCYYTVVSLAVLIFFYLLYEPLRSWFSILDIALIEPVVWGLFPLLVISLTLVTIRYEEKPLEYSMITLAYVGLTTICGIIAVSYYDLGVAGILWSNALVSWGVCLFFRNFGN